MKIKTTTLEVYSDEGFSVQNITHLVNEFVESTGVQEGQLVLFYKHTTGSLLLNENEVGAIADLEDALERIAPTDGKYLHHVREVDFNGYAHIRASLLPLSLTIPILGGRLTLGTHQEIQIIDNQPEALPRYVVLQVIGE